MNTQANHQQTAALLVERPFTRSEPFPPLDRETRHAVETNCAAFHLNRKPQTMRAWACLENGPLRPIRVNGRLAWPVADLRRVLGVAQ